MNEMRTVRAAGQMEVSAAAPRGRRDAGATS